MATISSPQGACFMGNPITLSLTSQKITLGKDDILAFHRLICEVTINALTLKFSTNVTDSETIQIDISSAFRAAADAYEHTYNQTTPPSYNASVKAYDEYMLNGTTTKSGETTMNIEGICVGRFSDFERLKNPTGLSLPTYCTTKPTSSPEIVCQGETIAYASQGQTTSYQQATALGSLTLGGNVFYVIPATANRYQFRFINSRGTLESIGVTALPKTETAITSKKYSLATAETFGKFSRGIVRKSNDNDSLSLTSGPLDEQWLSWFIHEFLMSEHVWMLIDSLWVRCHLEPEDAVNGLNRQKDAPLELQFTARLDINGHVPQIS